jgi:hypothetical protein
MERKAETLNLYGALGKVFLISALVSLPGPLLHAQEIQIRVLNGRNGKPVTNECLNVSLGPWHGADLLAPTDKSGVVVLHIAKNDVTADTACQGWSKQAHRAEGTDTISVMGDYYVACQEYGKISSREQTKPDALPSVIKTVVPSYTFKKILESGVSAANTCGKFRAEAKPGELILFVRPRGVLERLKQ